MEELKGRLFLLVISIIYLFIYLFCHQLRHKLLVLIMSHIVAFLDRVLADVHLHVTNGVEVEVVYILNTCFHLLSTEPLL